MFLITSRALDTDWFSFTLLAEFVHVTFGAGLPVAEHLTMTSLPSITSKGEEKLLLAISGPTFFFKKNKLLLTLSLVNYNKYLILVVIFVLKQLIKQSIELRN